MEDESILAAGDTATPGADSADASADVKEAPDGQTQTDVSEGKEKDGGEEGTAGKEGDAPEGEERGEDPEGAPEGDYEAFNFGEGVDVDPEVLGEFHEAAKAMNLSQAKAQELVDLQKKINTKAIQAQQEAASKQFESWTQDLQADPKFEENNASVHKMIAAVCDEKEKAAVYKTLENPFYGSNAPLVRLLWKASRPFQGDRFVDGNATTAPQSDDPAKVLFGDVKFTESE